MQTAGLFKNCVPKSMTSFYKTEHLRCTLIYLTFVSFDVNYKSDKLKNRKVHQRLSKSWNKTNLKVIPIKNAKPLSNDEVYLRFETIWFGVNIFCEFANHTLLATSCTSRLHFDLFYLVCRIRPKQMTQ